MEGHRPIPGGLDQSRRLTEAVQLLPGVFHRVRLQGLGEGQVGEHPRDPKPFQLTDSQQAIPVIPGEAQPVHAGVHGQVDLDPMGRMVQFLRVCSAHHSLRQPPAGKQPGLLRRCPAQNQDFTLNSSPAEPDALLQCGHCEGPHAAGHADLGGEYVSVAVGVGLHHGHQLTARGEQLGQLADVVDQSGAVNLRPGPQAAWGILPVPPTPEGKGE